MTENKVEALPIEVDGEEPDPTKVDPTKAAVTVKAAQSAEPGQIPRVTGTAGRPAWCKPFPQGFQVPKGKRPVFMRFRAEWTDTPHLGEAQCVCWGINVLEEHTADKRADEGGLRVVHERAKLSVRLVARADQSTLLPADYTKEVREADPDIFWEQVGLKCRSLIVNTFLQTHSLSPEERRDFFENCIEVRDAV